MATENIKSNTIIYAQGQLPENLCLLDSGAVEVLVAAKEYVGLNKDIIASKSKRIGVVNGKSLLSVFSSMLTEPYIATIRTIEDSVISRFPLKNGGIKGYLSSDINQGVTMLRQIFNVVNGFISSSSRYEKLSQTICKINDNISLMYKDMSQGDGPDDLHLNADELYKNYSGAGGVFPKQYSAQFLLSDFSKYFEKDYSRAEDSDYTIDKTSLNLIIGLLKLDGALLAKMIQAGPQIGLHIYSILFDDFEKIVQRINAINEQINQDLGLIFNQTDSWTAYLTTSGGFDQWLETGKIDKEFIKGFLTLITKINSLYEEITGKKITEDYPSIKSIHQYYVGRAEGKSNKVVTPVDNPAEKETVSKPVSQSGVSGSIKKSIHQIFEFAVTDQEFQNRFLKMLNDFKTLKNPMSTDADSRKVRRHVTKLYWDLYKKVYIRSKSESSVPRPVKLMINYGFLDEDLVEENQITELTELARQRDREIEIPVLYENEFLDRVYAGKTEPSITEMGLDYKAFLREEEKHTGRKPKDEGDADSNLNKVLYEIDQRLASTAAICSGSTATAFPILTSEVVRGPLQQLYTSKNTVNDIIMEMMNIDFSVFYRETVLKLGEAREIIKEEVLPFIILLPICGTKTLLWQELSGTNKRSRGRIVVPVFFVGDLKKSLAHTLACFRWELNRSLKGAMWADPIEGGVTGEYFDYVNTFKKMSKLSTEAKEKIAEKFKAFRTNRDRFADDYLQWIFFEKDGIMKQNTVVREMFYKHIPFKKDIRDRLQNMPAFAHSANRYVNIQKRDIAQFQRKFKKYQDENGNYPKEIEKFMKFLEL